MRIRNSTVVVTGATSGIGRETAILLAKKGAKVWAIGRDIEGLEALSNKYSRITSVAADITNDGDRARIADVAKSADILVNNAGVGWIGPIQDMPADEVRKLFETNVLGLIDLTQRILPELLERRHGHIVNVASIVGYVAVPPMTVYSATKFALRGFTQGLRRELSGTGITVAQINPGPTTTGFRNTAMGGKTKRQSSWAVPAVSANTVAKAITRSITRRRVPGYQTIFVPRVAGVLRLADLPLLSRLSDYLGSSLGPAFGGSRPH